MTQRLIDFMIKVAGVVLTSVATYQVAANTFSHLEMPWREVVTLGALLLVEGAFVVTWFALDTQRNAPMAMKVSWAITLVTIYGALLIIGIVNGEGSAGWAFRFILAVMIGKSMYDAGVYEFLKRTKKADRDIHSSYKVRKLARQVAKQKAVHALIDANKERAYKRELSTEVEKARLEAEHEAAMIDVRFHRELLLERVHAKDNLARGQFLASLAREELMQGTPVTPMATFNRNELEMRN